MSSSNLIRMAGLAAVLGGVLLVIASILDLANQGSAPSEFIPTSRYIFQQALYLLSGTLLLIGLVGLYARQSEAAGALGLVGFLVAFVGTVLVAGFSWTGVFVAPVLASAAPEIVNAGPPPGLLLSLITLGIGWLLFGVASLLSRVYPRAAVILLIVGAVLVVLPLPSVSVVLGAAVAWLGFILLSGRSAPVEQPARVS